jgi:hypothetical protein
MAQVPTSGKLGQWADIAWGAFGLGVPNDLNGDSAPYIDISAGAETKFSDFYGMWLPQIGGNFINDMPSYSNYNNTTNSEIGYVYDQSSGSNAGCQFQWQSTVGEWWEVPDHDTNYEYTWCDEAGDSNYDAANYWIKWVLISGEINGHTSGWDSGDSYVTADAYKYLSLWDTTTSAFTSTIGIFDIYIATSSGGANEEIRRYCMLANRIG